MSNTAGDKDALYILDAQNGFKESGQPAMIRIQVLADFGKQTRRSPALSTRGFAQSLDAVSVRRGTADIGNCAFETILARQSLDFLENRSL